jgi:hypothetical protein
MTPETSPLARSRVGAAVRDDDARATEILTWEGSDDELLNVKQASVLLSVKPSTLLAWTREERVPVYRLGPRHLRWTRPLLRQIRDAALDPGRRF